LIGSLALATPLAAGLALAGVDAAALPGALTAAERAGAAGEVATGAEAGATGEDAGAALPPQAARARTGMRARARSFIGRPYVRMLRR
jgi:hypothetical protein